MNCRKCNMPMENTYICPHCGHVDTVARKIIFSSNWHYNQGLAKARVKDLSGAVTSLNSALKYNKRNINARNLLGLVYYQMGELVPALSEWVISVHLQSSGNLAEGYIETIQNNPGRLQAANKVIQRYNKSLEYIKENKTDLAIIELKKAVNQSPNFVRAHQALGLLYMKTKQYRAARNVFMAAVKVDRNNITTLRYVRELNALSGKPKKSKGSNGFQRISDPNPIVIEENSGSNFSDYNTGFLSFVNVLIGIVIGAAAIWLLIVPSITKRSAESYNKQVVEYSAQIAERNKEIDGLKKTNSSLEAQLSKYKTEVGDTVGDTTVNESLLTQAMASFLQEDMYEAGVAIASIDPTAITDPQGKKIYDQLRDKTRNSVVGYLYQDAKDTYESGDYVAAIEGFTKVLRMEDEYTEAIFYMGRAYQQLGDAVNAATYYKRVIQVFPDSSLADDAQKYLDQIQRAAGNDTIDAAKAENAITNKKLAETEAETEETDQDDSSDDNDSDYEDSSDDNDSDYEDSYDEYPSDDEVTDDYEPDEGAWEDNDWDE